MSACCCLPPNRRPFPCLSRTSSKINCRLRSLAVTKTWMRPRSRESLPRTLGSSPRMHRNVDRSQGRVHCCKQGKLRSLMFISTTEMLQQLQAAKEGLTADEAEERLTRYGSGL